MRVTKKLLIKLVNELLVEVELPFECISITRSRFTSDQYQSGAWFWKANLKSTEGVDYILGSYIYSFYQFSDLETELNNGGKLKIVNNSTGQFACISNLEISL